MVAGSAEYFEPHVGAPFQVRGESAGCSLTLEEVRRLPEQPGAPRDHPFVLTFTGPADAPLPQSIHVLEQADGGVIDVFLVPVGPGATGRLRYEAVFN